MKRSYVIIFIAFISIVASFHYGYRYGLIDQQGELPSILHLQDQSLYPRDPVVLTIDEYGPRFFVYHLVALIGKFLTLEVLSFLGVLLINFFTLFLTWKAAETLFPKLIYAPFLAVFLVTAITNNPIDDYGLISLNFVPRRITMPLALLALVLALKQKPIAVGLVSVLGSLSHPLLATNAAVVAFAGMGFSMLLNLFSRRRLGTSASLKSWLHYFIGAGIFLISSYVLWIALYDSGAIDNKLLFELLTYRSPARYLPLANYGLKPFLYFTVFLGGALCAWFWWFKDSRQNPSQTGAPVCFLGMLIATGTLLVCSIIFVEFYPVIFFLKLEALDVVVLGHWLGLLILARSVGSLLAAAKDRAENSWWAMILLVGSGHAQPLLMVWGHLLADVSKLKSLRSLSFIGRFTGLFGVVLIVGFLLIRYGDLRVALSLILFGIITFWFINTSARLYRAVIPVLVLLVIVPVLLLSRNTGLGSSYTSMFSTVLNMSDAQHLPKWGASYGPIDDICQDARLNTPKDALFLSPPMESRFRIMSQRSLVIGFKVIITTPDGLPEWEERMNVCYGKSNRSGFEALKDFDHNYRQISIPKLAEIRQKYDAEYAFLYLETPSLNLPVLFQNRHYKLVDLRPLDKISDVSSENKNTQTN